MLPDKIVDKNLGDYDYVKTYWKIIVNTGMDDPGVCLDHCSHHRGNVWCFSWSMEACIWHSSRIITLF